MNYELPTLRSRLRFGSPDWAWQARDRPGQAERPQHAVDHATDEDPDRTYQPRQYLTKPAWYRWCLDRVSCDSLGWGDRAEVRLPFYNCSRSTPGVQGGWIPARECPGGMIKSEGIQESPDSFQNIEVGELTASEIVSNWIQRLIGNQASSSPIPVLCRISMFDPIAH